jgi:hypothetical protein
MKEVAKWQFIRRHHPPREAASLIRDSAFLPWPLPREILSSFLVMFISSANLMKSAIGSEPAESTKIRGIVIEESLKLFDKLKVGGSMKGLPIFSMIKFCTASAILSGLKLFRIMIFWKELSFWFHSPGIGVL